MAFETERRDFWISDDMPEEVTPFWAMTDEQGRFAFHHLPARAQITLLASHPNFAPTQLPPPEEWMPIRTGQGDVVLVMALKSFVTGQVLADSKPAAKAQVICSRLWRGEDKQRFATDANGRFKGMLPEGNWLIYAVADEGHWQSEPKYVTINPGETVSVTLNLSRAVEVRGVVKDAKKKTPVPFAAVTAYRELRLPEIRINWRMEEVKTDEKGAFSFICLLVSSFN